MLNFLVDSVTIDKTVGDGVITMFKGIGKAMIQIKEGGGVLFCGVVYHIMPEMMTFMGEVWVIIIPIGFAMLTWVFNFVMRIFGSFRR